MPHRSANTPALRDSSGNTIHKAPMDKGKRKVEVLDLTGSDDEVAYISQSRKITKSSNGSGPSAQPQRNDSGSFTQSQRDEWVEDGDEDEVIVMSQDGSAGVGETFELYGTLDTKIVGVRYYNGHATVGEHVLVRREATNPFDSNAIRVDNVQRDQIGHIPRQYAAKLAPYMDTGALIVSGILSGQRGEYDCPIRISLYGTNEPTAQANLKSRMQADKLPLEALNKREKEAKKRKTAEPKKVGKKGANQGPQFPSSQGDYAGGSSQNSNDVGQSLDDIMLESERFNPREMGNVVEKFGTGEAALADMPMANDPERLCTPLLPYQKQGLAWLLDKENPRVPPVGSTDVVQLWKRAPVGGRLFTNIATNFFIKDKEPILASGGILADDMGLGKTLQIIALIVADLDIARSRSGPNNNVPKTTLIIAPVSVMSNWSTQVRWHY